MGHNDPRPTKAQRREAARAEAARLKAEQEARSKRTRTITIAGILILVLVVGGIIWWVLASAKDNPKPTATGPNSAELTGEVVTENQSGSTEYHAGAPGSISFGKDGFGSVNEGAPVVELYADFTCGHCFQFDLYQLGALEKMAENGEATIVVHPVAILDPSGNFTGYSSQAANAAYAIAKDDPDNYDEATHNIFNVWWQWNQSRQGEMPNTAELAAAVKDAGVKQEIVDAITNRSLPQIAENSTKAFYDAGFSGTPTLLLNGESIDNEHWIQDDNGEYLRNYLLEQAK